MKTTKEMTATQCIYCHNGEGTSREHIIPDALLARIPNDAWIIHNASCTACQKTINVYETDIIRNLYRGWRHATGVKQEKVQIFRIDNTSIYSPDAYIFLRPVLAIPSALTGLHNNSSWNIRNVLITIYDPKKLYANTLRNSNITEDTELAELSFNPLNFRKMLAKIAYGFCVLHYGEGFFERSTLPSIARGIADNLLNQYVGSITREEQKEKFLIQNHIRKFKTKYHEVNIVQIKNSIVTILKLFREQSKDVDYAVVSANL